MKYEAFESQTTPGVWHVSCFDNDIATFTGPRAKFLAEEYAYFMNS